MGACGRADKSASLGFQILALVCDLGEAVPKLTAPLLVDLLTAGGLVLAKLLDHVRLLPLQILDLGTDRRCPCRSWVLHDRLVRLGGNQQGVTVRTEDAVDEEATDQIQ